LGNLGSGVSQRPGLELDGIGSTNISARWEDLDCVIARSRTTKCC
jgi:hypothetical protein